MRHSGAGIASFVLTSASALVFVMVVVAAVLWNLDTGFGAGRALVFVLVGVTAVDFTGLGLSLAGLFTPDRKRVFAFLGLGVFLLTLAVMVTALMSGPVRG